MRLTESDASFLYGETASGPLQTAGIAIIEGEMTFDEAFNHYATRIHLVPRLRQRLMFVPMNLAHPKWVDDPDFDINNHVVHVEVPKRTTVEEGIAQMCELNEGLMDRNIPLWKFFVMTGIKGHTLILQQIHHAMIDGASAVQMSTVLLDFEADAEDPVPPTEAWQPPRLPTQMELVTEALQENAEAAFRANPMAAFSTAPETQEHFRRGAAAMTRFITEPAIGTPWNSSTLGPKRRLEYAEHGFAEFREIRRAFGGTINDVVLSVASEGAARYLEAHDEYTTNQKFRVMCPVNVRTEDEVGALGNRVSAIFPMLPAYHMDMFERHQLVCAETNRIKEDQEAQAMTAMQEGGVSIPPIVMAPLLLVGTPFDPTRFGAANPPPVMPRMGTRPPTAGINFVLTNVPGVQVQQYLAGRKVASMTAIMMMGGNMGLGIAVTSYNQKMIINLTADPRLIPDLDQMMAHMNDAYDDFLKAAREQNATAAA